MEKEKNITGTKVNNKERIFDLAQRTRRFASDTILFVKKIKINTINRPIISQLIRAATSIGANYMEADCAESKNDFRHKIAISKKESKESAYWLDILAVSDPEYAEKCKELKKEAIELNLIFVSIIRSLVIH